MYSYTPQKQQSDTGLKIISLQGTVAVNPVVSCHYVLHGSLITYHWQRLLQVMPNLPELFQQWPSGNAGGRLF